MTDRIKQMAEEAERFRQYNLLMQPYIAEVCNIRSMLVPERYVISGGWPTAVYAERDQSLINKAEENMRMLSDSIREQLGIAPPPGES